MQEMQLFKYTFPVNTIYFILFSWFIGVLLICLPRCQRSTLSKTSVKSQIFLVNTSTKMASTCSMGYVPYLSDRGRNVFLDAQWSSLPDKYDSYGNYRDVAMPRTDYLTETENREHCCTVLVLFVCVEVLRPCQQLRSCPAGQLPINTVPGQAYLLSYECFHCS